MDSKTAQDGPRLPPRRPKKAQQASKFAQDASKTAQDGPKTAQDGPKTAQDDPKMTPRCSSRSHKPGTPKSMKNGPPLGPRFGPQNEPQNVGFSLQIIMFSEQTGFQKMNPKHCKSTLACRGPCYSLRSLQKEHLQPCC